LPLLLFFVGAILIASVIPNSQAVTRIFAGSVGGSVSKSNSQSISRAFAGAMLIAIIIVCFCFLCAGAIVIATAKPSQESLQDPLEALSQKATADLSQEPLQEVCQLPLPFFALFLFFQLQEKQPVTPLLPDFVLSITKEQATISQ